MEEEFDSTEHSGLFAEFYDILHAGNQDISGYLELADKYGPRVLELGSGTGRILLALAKENYQVTGIEISRDMLKICREKLAEENQEIKNNVTLIAGDIKEVSLENAFDLILAPCNLLNYFLEVSEIKQIFKRVEEHLAAEGVFIVDNSIPDIPFMVENNGKEEVFRFTNPKTGRLLVDRFTASYDFVNQLEYDQIELEEYQGDQLVRSAETRETLTYFFPRELKLMLESSGLKIIEERGSLLEPRPITENSSEMVFICRV